MNWFGKKCKVSFIGQLVCQVGQLVTNGHLATRAAASDQAT